ncbi:MAG: MerR family DNA-binding transcriptional regulator, partial [Promethearchaeota archaeon]
MSSFFLSIGHVASLLGVSTKPLRRWDRSGKCKADFRTAGNHRRYKRARILAFLREKAKPHEKKKVALYGRVSSTRQ